MFKDMMVKTALITATVLPFAVAAADNKENWVDMSDPTAIYSSASIGGGNQGVDISGTYGGYLGGEYKHRFNAQVKNDLEYYEFNYLLLNSATKSGLAIDSAWSKDIRVDHVTYKSTNDVSLNFFAKLGFIDDKLNFYPKMGVGYMWADKMSDTTYVKFDATTRYSFNKMFWVGVTPTYTYGMKGLELNEWEGSIDAGVQLSESFGLSASFNDDKDFSAQVMFAF